VLYRSWEQFAFKSHFGPPIELRAVDNGKFVDGIRNAEWSEIKMKRFIGELRCEYES
jgi:hypothetical protein